LEFFNTIIPKIENIIEYNRINHKTYGLNSNNIKKAGINNLSDEDLRTLSTLLKSHPDINETTLGQVERPKPSHGKVRPLKAPRGTLIRYLDDFKNGKIEFMTEYARAEAERFKIDNAEAERLGAKAEAERIRAKAEAEYLRAEAERLSAKAEAERIRAKAEAEYLRAEADRVNAANAEAERLRVANAEAERL